MNKKGVEFTIGKIVSLVLIIAVIIIAFVLLKNIDIIKEGIDKFLVSIASFK